MGAAGGEGAGHRGRLRRRLLETGGDGLLDHELIEYLLALAVPRRDTKPLARRLLDEFGGIPALLSADPLALARIDGMGETSVAALKIVQAAAVRMLRSQASTAPVLSSWHSLIDYLHADMAHCLIERVRLLHLNSKNMLIRDELIAQGSVDQAAVHVREIIARALQLGSTALILVHNHPSGDPAPSRADISLTRDIAETGRRLGIELHDHVIIGTQGHVSLRQMGLLS